MKLTSTPYPSAKAPKLQYRPGQLENIRLELLADLYDSAYLQALLTYRQVLKFVQKAADPTENDLKCLNQIQVIYRRFKPFPDDLQQGFSDCHKKLAAWISHNLRISLNSPGVVELNKWHERLKLSKTQSDLMFRTAMTFQLTSGCSNFCLRCNEWALPGVRKRFSFDAIQKIIFGMTGQKNNEISLFGASDPLDWEGQGRSITDIVELVEKTPVQYSLLTKVPKGKSKLLIALVKKGANLSVSVTSKNKNRVRKIQKETGDTLSRQHDTDDLMIPAGLDEDFLSVKPSITDGYGCEITPDGAFIIVPTFTSALHPFGHVKIPITSQTEFFPLKKTGRHALLVDYFKPLCGFDMSMRLHHLDRLLDAQVETLILDNGSDELTPPGMRSAKEYLSIFDEKARQQRKKMTLSVFRRLKKEHLPSSGFKALSKIEQAAYKKKIQRHLDLCKKEYCRKARLHTLAFFLRSAATYLEKNRLKRAILRRLLQAEIRQSTADSIQNLLPDRADKLFCDPVSDPFITFRYFICRMVDKPAAIHAKSDIYFPAADFTKRFSARYDPVTDLFVPATES